MANTYDEGDMVRCSNSAAKFTDASTSTVFDPDVVRGKFQDPSGNETVYVYGADAELVKAATGSYYFDIPIDEAGVWYARIEGETSAGAPQGAHEEYFNVRSTEF